MALALGSSLLVRYNVGGAPEFHARQILAHVVDGQYVCLTPDFDVYCEDYNGPDFLEVFVRPPDNSVPAGVPPQQVYDFLNVVSGPALIAYLEQGRTEAIATRVVLGIAAGGVPAAAPAYGAGIGGGALGHAVPAPPPGGALQAAVGPCLVQPPPLAGIGAPAAPGLLGPVASALAAGGSAAPAVGVAPAFPGFGLGGGLGGGGGGLAGLAQGLGVSLGSIPVANAGSPAAHDLRTLAVKFDEQGKRHRDFRSGVLDMSEELFDDYPIKGPRCLHWGLKFMLEHGNSPTGWHSKWKSDLKLQATDPGVETHDTLCRIFQFGTCYDQLNLGNCVIAETMMRELMFVEEKHKDRATGAGKDGGGFSEKALFTGHEARVNLCIMPELVAYIGDEMRKEALIMKERRKAREERALMKPEKNPPK